MIPVVMQPEPADFDIKVRQEGRKFLSRKPTPGTKDWKNHEYWCSALPDLQKSYKHICSYCATWVSRPAGSPTVDHYIPKSSRPDLAYEWDNFRFACLTMNTRKGICEDVLDPFQIQYNWFVLDFSSYLIKPHPSLEEPIKSQVKATIKRLKLNDDDACVESRQRWISEYTSREIDFSHLHKKAPFIAYELKRQGLVP